MEEAEERKSGSGGGSGGEMKEWRREVTVVENIRLEKRRAWTGVERKGVCVGRMAR